MINHPPYDHKTQRVANALDEFVKILEFDIEISVVF